MRIKLEFLLWRAKIRRRVAGARIWREGVRAAISRWKFDVRFWLFASEGRVQQRLFRAYRMVGMGRARAMVASGRHTRKVFDRVFGR